MPRIASDSNNGSNRTGGSGGKGGFTRLTDYPKWMKPFIFHGLRADYRENSEEQIADCPFCGKEKKLYLNSTTSLWDCKSCGLHGNLTTFLRELWKLSEKLTKDYSSIQTSRKLLYDDTALYWELVLSATTGDWLVPGYGVDGKLQQLYRYIKEPTSGKYRLYATPEVQHYLHGVNLLQKNRSTVYVCEGPWDAMALWEVMRNTKVMDGVLTQTASESASLLNQTNVLAVPGCNVFNPNWAHLLADKIVVFLYDNDYPKEVQGRRVDPAGLSGLKRVIAELSRAEQPPYEVHYLNWGPDGYNPDLPEGYDVRDLLSSGVDLPKRIKALERLFGMLTPIPHDWVPGGSPGKKKKGSVEMECVPCSSWKELTNQWRKAVKLTDGIYKALTVMLATVASTRALGDQLWTMIMGPPACGKSTLCEALSVNKHYTLAKSTIRGFHSGWKTDKDGSEDHSLISLVTNKTLITKDGDTLLQSPNLSQILSEARDLYDSTSRTHYRHGLKRDYEGVRMTWILCGTNSLRTLDQSELGERFLKCVIMEGIDDELEDEILIRVANRSVRNLKLEADGKAETQYDPELSKAMQLTGGYVAYLRENARDLLSILVMDEASKRKCIRLGKFVAYMRARPSAKQEEVAEREFASRLVSQIIRLAQCVAVVLNKASVDQEVMEIVTKVAFDTARGRTLDLLKHLYREGDKGAESLALAMWTNHPEEKERAFLRFMRKIGIVETFRPKLPGGQIGKVRWRITSKLKALYGEVLSCQKQKTEGEES